MTERRTRLRSVTADIHEALHGADPFARIAEGRMDRQAYAALLRFLFRYHAAMEAPCAAGAARLGVGELAQAHRRRLAALSVDLAALGASAATPAPMPGDGDFAVGILYTVLGSTLGGKVIHRQLDHLLPDDEGRRFFRGEPGDGANWRLFCARLEEADLDMAQLEAGAAHAFARFQEMLETKAALAAV